MEYQAQTNGSSWLGAVINASDQIHGIGNDLVLRKNLYHDPYMNDLVSTRSNAEIAFRRHENLAYTRSRLSPLGRAYSNSMKPLSESLAITNKIASGAKGLGMLNAGISGLISTASLVKGVGVAGIAFAAYSSADEIVSSGYNTRVIVNEVGGWAAAAMMGSMGAAYGSALGPVGALAGGMIFGAIGYYYGSGKGF